MRASVLAATLRLVVPDRRPSPLPVEDLREARRRASGACPEARGSSQSGPGSPERPRSRRSARRLRVPARDARRRASCRRSRRRADSTSAASRACSSAPAPARRAPARSRCPAMCVRDVDEAPLGGGRAPRLPVVHRERAEDARRARGSASTSRPGGRTARRGARQSSQSGSVSMSRTTTGAPVNAAVPQEPARAPIATPSTARAYSVGQARRGAVPEPRPLLVEEEERAEHPGRLRLEEAARARRGPRRAARASRSSRGSGSARRAGPRRRGAPPRRAGPP